VFGPKDHVYTEKDFAVTRKEDPKAIDAAVQEEVLKQTSVKQN